MLTWLLKGVDIQYARDTTIPVIDVYYADDTILLSINEKDMQARFSILERLAQQVGLDLNRDKTVIMLAKLKSNIL